MKTMWIATTNRGKLNEFETLLKNHDFKVCSLKDMPSYTPPPETGTTFEDNARIKARSLKAIHPHSWILADDSGLVVPGLNNFPGVHSARYAGPKATDAENIAKVLKMVDLRTAWKRDAFFKCVLVGYKPTGEEFMVQGELKGQIAKSPRGRDGFGYDPIFIPEGYEQTIAELGLAVKNKISHRSKALAQLVSFL